MDSAEQAAGEKRVKELLFEPLRRLGLGRPNGMTVAVWEEGQREAAAKLAYMTPAGLASLEEQVRSHPEGKSKDRMAALPKILEWAVDIEAPKDTSSPLLRNVFAAPSGRQAMQEGWGPELRRWLKKHRRWPKQALFEVIRKEARADMERFKRIAQAIEAGQQVPSGDQHMFDSRNKAQAICEELVAMGQMSGEAAE